MSSEITKINPNFLDVMPKEYLEIIENGQFGSEKLLGDLGTFKELVEEHPLCAGCNLALAFRVLVAAIPDAANTIFVGSTGCSSLIFTQLGVHNIHSLFGNQNAVASGLKRALKIRFPDKEKDVIVMAGDGATADIGLDMTMHSWFRKEKITTVMFDNELYANTGGQESGMSPEGCVLYMAPTGKKFSKIDLTKIAVDAGCAYIARVSTARPKNISDSMKKAVLVSRNIGPTFIQIFTPCPTNLKIKPSETRKVAEEKTKSYYTYMEYISDDAKKYLDSLKTEE